MFPTRSDTNRAVQLQKMARGLKFRIKIEVGSYYPCSETKGADQLRSYCATDLRLCFRICKIPGFLMTWLIYENFFLMVSINIAYILSGMNAAQAYI